MSQRSSVEGHVSLLDFTDCHTLLSDSGTEVNSLLAERPIRHFAVADIFSWMAEKPTEHYPYKRSFEEGAHDPFIVALRRIYFSCSLTSLLTG